MAIFAEVLFFLMVAGVVLAPAAPLAALPFLGWLVFDLVKSF